MINIPIPIPIIVVVVFLLILAIAYVLSRNDEYYNARKIREKIVKDELKLMSLMEQLNTLKNRGYLTKLIREESKR